MGNKQSFHAADPPPTPPSTGRFQYHIPTSWFLLPRQPTSLANPLPTNHKRYREISGFFLKTLPNSYILSIQRVKNYEQYNLFAAKHEALSHNEGRPVALRMLFHGTQKTTPEAIIHSAAGFDPRWSHEGRWGLGAYFAVNASYSDSYAHWIAGDPNGPKQMFCAMVIIGESIDLSPNNALRMPPPRPGKQGRCYDSVKGKTGGSEVYITYETNTAYPSFLITYSPN